MLRLTKEREAKGWSRTQLGYEARIHPADIGKLEAGKIFPYESFKRKLEKIFLIPGDELFKEVD